MKTGTINLIENLIANESIKVNRKFLAYFLKKVSKENDIKTRREQKPKEEIISGIGFGPQKFHYVLQLIANDISSTL